MGININSNLSLGSKLPLDSRQVVDTLDDLLALDTNILYNGIQVYVNELDVRYQYHEEYNETSTGNWKLSTGGGGGDNSTTLTQEEYEALTEEEKLDGLYYTYDTKRIYKNGVQYGASEPIPLTMEEYKALKEAGAIDEQQEYLIEANTEGILLGAEDIGYNNAESDIQATTVQGAISAVNDSLVDLSTYSTEETKVGTWVDGKTIYRIYVSFPAFELKQNEWNIVNSLSITGIDEIINARAKRSEDNAIIPLAARSSGTSIEVNPSTNFGISKLILEYTKQ